MGSDGSPSRRLTFWLSGAGRVAPPRVRLRFPALPVECCLSLRDTPMASKQSVERGQRYRDVHASRLGAFGSEWIVEAVFRGTDGIVYAQLVCATDETQQKTLSVHALSDRQRFERL
jgi:hypothetical protein